MRCCCWRKAIEERRARLEARGGSIGALMIQSTSKRQFLEIAGWKFEVAVDIYLLYGNALNSGPFEIGLA
jgi:hypothetical protein